MCEELGYALGIDPFFIFTNWKLERVKQSYFAYKDRANEYYKFHAAINGIDTSDKPNSDLGIKYNGEIKKDSRGRILPDVNKLRMLIK